MVELVLGDGGHTFDASLKTITLAAPYTALSEGQILKIVDLTVGEVIYDADVQRYPISISGAVITHTYDNAQHADADLLQVTIDIGGTSSPIYVAIGSGASTVGDNRKVVTTAGTRVALAGSTAVTEVTITAETDNPDIVVVGGSTVVAALGTRRGTPLYPSDSTTIVTDDLAEVFIDSLVSGEGVTFTYSAV